MSIRSLTTLAVARDIAPRSAAVAGGSAGVGGGTQKQTAIDALTSAIPTEPLAAYTGFVSILAALKHSGSYPYLPLRWWAYAAFLLVVAVSIQISYRAKVSKPEPVGATDRKRVIPLPEILSALIAAAAWGLIMPGSALQSRLTGDTATVVTACIAFGGAALLALMSPTLTKGSHTGSAPPVAAPQNAQPVAAPQNAQPVAAPQNAQPIPAAPEREPGGAAGRTPPLA
jgi:hypothetical protein